MTGSLGTWTSKLSTSEYDYGEKSDNNGHLEVRKAVLSQIKLHSSEDLLLSFWGMIGK